MKKIQELLSKINNFVNKNYFNIANPPCIGFIIQDGVKSVSVSVPGFNMAFLSSDLWKDLNFDMGECSFSVRVSDLNNVFSTLKNKKKITTTKSGNNIKFESEDADMIEIPQSDYNKPKAIKKCKEDCIVIPIEVMDSVLYRSRACFYTVNHTPIYNTIKLKVKSGFCRFVSGNGSLFCIQDIKCEIPDGEYCLPYSCLSFLHEINKITKDDKIKFNIDGNKFHVENDYFLIEQESELDFNKWPNENKILDTEREINGVFSSESLKLIRDNLQLSMMYKKDDELLVTDFSMEDKFNFKTSGKIKTSNFIDFKSKPETFSGKMYTRLLLDLVNSMPDDDVDVSFSTSKQDFRNKNFPIICNFVDEDTQVSIICTQA